MPATADWLGWTRAPTLVDGLDYDEIDALGARTGACLSLYQHYIDGRYLRQQQGAVWHEECKERIAQARKAAQVCALNLLYRLREACDGDLDRVDGILRLGGFVNCAPGFGATPAVIDGATEVFIELFGDAGWHARTAVGVCGLPGNAAVEVDAVVRLRG